MADIFIGYSTQDKARIRPLAEALRAEGWEVFWDSTVRPGDNWHKVIEQKLKASRCVVVAWTKASVKSKWVLQEAMEGMERDTLIPLNLDAVVQGRYDLVIGDLNAINFVLMKFLPNESKGLEILPKSVGMSKLYIAVSKANPKHAKIVKDFNQALRSMQKDGTYQAIINAHRQQP